ncbi:hypothetical protein PG993_008091 [Apiospora rasikravindrae]|uniref:Uncharacterized protein n=1 Tax=Apiospora rasikravindrae TaxID=990691 RepID=A0ABR1T149_9PEZI
MAQRRQPSRRAHGDLATTSHPGSSSQPNTTTSTMGRNRNNNRRRKQGQKRAEEQRQHSRNVSSASSSATNLTHPSTPAQEAHPLSQELEQHSSSDGEDEQEVEKEQEQGQNHDQEHGQPQDQEKDSEQKAIERVVEKVFGKGAGGNKDSNEAGRAAANRGTGGDERPNRPVAQPPMPYTQGPVTRQRLLVGGLWTAAFLSLMAQMMFQPDSGIEWREALRGPAFVLAAVGLSMSVMYMRGMDIQFSDLLSEVFSLS